MFWVTAKAPDGTTYTGIISEDSARKVHFWLNVNDSQPDLVELRGIPVIATPAHGGNSVESIWGRGNLHLLKTNTNGLYNRDVSLEIIPGAPFMVDSWISGTPQLIFFPGIRRYPGSLTGHFPATLTQVSQLRADPSVYDRERNNNRRVRSTRGTGGRDGDVT